MHDRSAGFRINFSIANTTIATTDSDVQSGLHPQGAKFQTFEERFPIHSREVSFPQRESVLIQQILLLNTTFRPRNSIGPSRSSGVTQDHDHKSYMAKFLCEGRVGVPRKFWMYTTRRRPGFLGSNLVCGCFFLCLHNLFCSPFSRLLPDKGNLLISRMSAGESIF